MISVKRLKKVTPAQAKDLVMLARTLHDDDRGSLRIADVKKALSDKNVYIIVAQDGQKIIGVGSLYILHKIASTSGLIEDVIVDSTYRGQGLGEKIVRAMIEEGRKQKIKSVFLTSRPVRTAAHALYFKVGFVKKETDVLKYTY